MRKFDATSLPLRNERLSSGIKSQANLIPTSTYEEEEANLEQHEILGLGPSAQPAKAKLLCQMILF